MPWPSQIKWRLLPRLALSVGFGPVSSPQKRRVPNSCQSPRVTSRSGHHEKASPAMRNGSNPKFRPAASRATVASSSSRSRNPVLSAAAAREYHYGARKLCPRGKPGLSDAVAHLAAWATDLAEEVRSNSTTHQKRAHQPYEGPPAAIGCRSCGRFTMGFVTGSKHDSILPTSLSASL